MGLKKRKLLLLPATALAAAAAFAAVSLASPSDGGLNLTSVPVGEHEVGRLRAGERGLARS